VTRVAADCGRSCGHCSVAHLKLLTDAACSAIFFRSGRNARVDLVRSGKSSHADGYRFRGALQMLKLPPPVWTLAYILIAVGVSYLLGWPRVPGLPLAWLDVVLIVLGIGLSVTSAMLFRREGAEINPTSPTNRKLVTSGPFRLTRNPMYLGLVLATLGIALWVGAWPTLLAPIALFATANWVHIPFEEEKMRRQFGAAFDAYASKTRRWI
jgi:protein-S-isoprenylcysteine O-methyltransferase Ste14